MRIVPSLVEFDIEHRREASESRTSLAAFLGCEIGREVVFLAANCWIQSRFLVFDVVL